MNAYLSILQVPCFPVYILQTLTAELTASILFGTFKQDDIILMNYI